MGKLGFADIFAPGDQQLLGGSGREPLKMADVQTYLTKISYPVFNDAGLSLKRLSVIRETGGDEQNTAVKSTVMISPDAFLLCYDDDDDGVAAAAQDMSGSAEAVVVVYRHKPDACFAIE